MIFAKIFVIIKITYNYRGLGTNPLRDLRYLLQSQYWTSEKVMSNQNTLFKNIVNYSLTSVKYYKDHAETYVPLIKANQEEKSPELSKDTVRRFLKDFHSAANTPYKSASTSGSTGVPLKIIRSKVAVSMLVAGHYRFHSWFGIKPWDKHVIIWGAAKEEKKGIFKNIKSKLINAPLVFDEFKIDKSNISEILLKIILYKPAYIRGYVSSIKKFAQLIKENNLDCSRLKLKLIITTSEILTSFDRFFIEKTLGCRVANEYGSRDGGQFAYECPEGCMHLQEEYMKIFTNSSTEMVSTELYNYAMPIINYKVGDRVIISDKKCKCGRNGRIVETIEGRQGDFIVTPEGKHISHWVFYYIMRDVESFFPESILQFKIIQKGNTFIVNLVKGANFSPSIITFIKERMIKEIGEISVEINFVETIEKTKNGKLLHFERVDS